VNSRCPKHNFRRRPCQSYKHPHPSSYCWKRALAAIDAGVSSMAAPANRAPLQARSELLSGLVAVHQAQREAFDLEDMQVGLGGVGLGGVGGVGWRGLGCGGGGAGGGGGRGGGCGGLGCRWLGTKGGRLVPAQHLSRCSPCTAGLHPLLEHAGLDTPRPPSTPQPAPAGAPTMA
jgi:hypothetical protein